MKPATQPLPSTETSSPTNDPVCPADRPQERRGFSTSLRFDGGNHAGLRLDRGLPLGGRLLGELLCGGLLLLLLLLPAGTGCSVEPNVNVDDAGLDRDDDDGDGFSEAQGDCDDTRAHVHPDAQEIVDGIDNNCDGLVDDDLDGDGFPEADDCDDLDPLIHPMATEKCDDGVDNNCNGLADDEEPDRDGDGFNVCQGDCNDNERGISPGNVEDPTDGVDNNCNGVVDEPDLGCDCGGEPGLTVEEQMTRAIGICNHHGVLSVQAHGAAAGYGAFADFGAITPRVSADGSGLDGLPVNNCQFAILATGPVRNPTPQTSDMDLGVMGASDPAPNPDGADINDLTQLELRLKVPGNAKGFSFDFVFFSVEYPEFVCSMFNDTFYALVLDEPQLGGGARTNISFDNEHNEITVNAGFFEYPPYWSLDISGTHYEGTDPYTSCSDDPGLGCTAPDPCPGYLGSTTGWLRTTSPATPGEEITLIFSIHDEGDSILDSAVVIDNFRWLSVPVDDPGTVK